MHLKHLEPSRALNFGSPRASLSFTHPRCPRAPVLWNDWNGATGGTPHGGGRTLTSSTWPVNFSKVLTTYKMALAILCDFHQSHGVSENIPDNMGSAMICWFESQMSIHKPSAFQHKHNIYMGFSVRTDPPVLKHGNWTFTKFIDDWWWLAIVYYKLPFLRDFQTPRGFFHSRAAAVCCQNLRLPLSSRSSIGSGAAHC